MDQWKSEFDIFNEIVSYFEKTNVTNGAYTRRTLDRCANVKFYNNTSKITNYFDTYKIFGQKYDLNDKQQVDDTASTSATISSSEDGNNDQAANASSTESSNSSHKESVPNTSDASESTTSSTSLSNASISTSSVLDDALAQVSKSMSEDTTSTPKRQRQNNEVIDVDSDSDAIRNNMNLYNVQNLSNHKKQPKEKVYYSTHLTMVYNQPDDLPQKTESFESLDIKPSWTLTNATPFKLLLNLMSSQYKYDLRNFIHQDPQRNVKLDRRN